MTFFILPIVTNHLDVSSIEIQKGTPDIYISKTTNRIGRGGKTRV